MLRRLRRGWRGACALSHDSNQQQARAASAKPQLRLSGRRTLRRARPARGPRAALRVPGAPLRVSRSASRSAKGASTTGRTATLNARSSTSAGWSDGLRSRRSVVRIHSGALKLRRIRDRNSDGAICCYLGSGSDPAGAFEKFRRAITRSILLGFRWTTGKRRLISTSSDSSSRPAVCSPAPQHFPLGLQPNATTFDFNHQTIQRAPRRRFRLERSARCAALPSDPACRSRADPLWQRLARLVQQLRGGYGRRSRQHDRVRGRHRRRAADVQQRSGLRHRVRRHAEQRLALRRLRDQVSARCILRRRRLHVPDWAASLRHGLCKFGY